MSRVRTTTLLAATVSLLLAGFSPATVFGDGSPQTVVTDFANDPMLPHGGDALFFGRGAGAAAAFVHEPGTRARFSSDARGSLRVTYDSLEPTSRLYTVFAGGFTQDDDFVLGAVLTIRPDGFAPDPFGFHPIAFSLFNASTTGDDRTGDLNDFAADTFDTVEFSYFANVSPFFGGPFLSPDVFGRQSGPDAFANFTFGTVPLALQPGVTYLVQMEHSAAARTLTTQVWVVKPDGAALPVPGGIVTVDTSRVSGFLVDSLGISMYHDGFNVFASSGRSLHAVVDYDLLFSGPKIDGTLPAEIAKALKRFTKRAGRLTLATPGDPVLE